MQKVTRVLFFLHAILFLCVDTNQNYSKLKFKLSQVHTIYSLNSIFALFS